MSIEKVRAYFEHFDIADRIREFDVSSATVELAAVAVGVEGARIAKSMSFKLADDQPIIIVTAGDMKIDNAKFKYQVHPGDTLVFSLLLKAPIRRGICHMEGRAFVGDRLVCEADLMALITRKDDAK